MFKIEWKNSFNTDIKEIDGQHKGMIEIINELYDIIAAKSDDYSLSVIFDKLNNYADVHFATEEKYMKQFNFDKIEEHIKEHNYFREHLTEFKRNYPLGQDKIKVDLMNFLKDWLLNHIMDMDKEYVPLFKEKGL